MRQRIRQSALFRRRGLRSLAAGGAIWLLAVVLVPAQAHGQGCIDYGDYLHFVGNADTPAVYAVAVAGSYAYVTDLIPGELLVVDISDPTTAATIGGVDMPGSARDVVVDGSHAYVADGSEGLQVVDVSNPAAPAIVGNVPGISIAVAKSGNHAYVADLGSGLLVIDVSNPTVPAILGSVAMPASAQAVAVAGSHAYLADGSAGLQIVDVSDPATPAIVGSVAMPSAALGVAVAGSHAYIADQYSGLQIVDISNPLLPAIVATADTPHEAVGVAVEGSHAYVANRTFDEFAATGALTVFDITDPTSPAQVGELLGFIADDVAVAGSHAYVANEEGPLRVVDVSNPASPAAVGSADTPGFAVAVNVAGSHAYVADYLFGLQVIDISNPTTPSIVGSVDTPGSAGGLAVDGAYAYVADGSAGLQVVDISNPTAPSIVGSVDTPGSAAGLAVDGAYAYVADGSAGLQLVDISNPSAPTIVGSVGITPSDAYGVAVVVAGSTAYLLDDYARLFIIDASDPTMPMILGEVGTPLTNYTRNGSVALLGSYAYVNFLHVVDVSIPTSPTIVASSELQSSSAPGLAIVGSTAYAVTTGFGLQVFDVSNPNSPLTLGSAPGSFQDAAVDGDYVYAAAASLGLQIFSAQCEPATAVAEPVRNPASLNARVFPNPSAQVAIVRFRTGLAGPCEVALYDVRGRLVRQLFQGVLEIGQHALPWDGRSEAGESVASGVYYMRISTAEGTGVARHVVLR